MIAERGGTNVRCPARRRCSVVAGIRRERALAGDPRPSSCEPWPVTSRKKSRKAKPTVAELIAAASDITGCSARTCSRRRARIGAPRARANSSCSSPASTPISHSTPSERRSAAVTIRRCLHGRDKVESADRPTPAIPTHNGGSSRSPRFAPACTSRASSSHPPTEPPRFCR